MMQYLSAPLRSWARTLLNRLYYLRRRRALKRILAKRKIHDLRPFKLGRWHHDLCTFTADLFPRPNKVFIKVSRVKGVLENEHRAYEIIHNNELLSKYAIKMFDYFSEGPFDVLVLEYQTGHIPTDSWMLDNLKGLGQLFDIVDEFSRLSLVHRDLKPDNLLVSGDRIKMFDFTFMISKEAKWGLKELDISQNKNMATLEVLGHGFKPSAFKWDDYYSLMVIFTNLLINISLSKTKEQERMLLRHIDRCKLNVGRNSYILPTGYQ